MRSLRWPPPPPGRVRWAWLLGLNARRWRMRRLWRLAGPMVPEGAVVADVGSGPGYDIEALGGTMARPARRRLLIDPQRGMLERARRKPLAPGGDDRSWMIGDAAQLPLKSGSVDLLLSIGVLCCMTESSVDLAVRECHRVLRPGGVLVFAVPTWRGKADEARLLAAGLAVRASIRAGLGVFSKPL